MPHPSETMFSTMCDWHDQPAATCIDCEAMHDAYMENLMDDIRLEQRW